jgi:hypothetical protein
MQQGLETTRGYSEVGRGTPIAATPSGHENDIDPMTLARLDVGLFRCLQNLGTSRARICSALCLSFDEYDYISTLLSSPR